MTDEDRVGARGTVSEERADLLLELDSKGAVTYRNPPARAATGEDLPDLDHPLLSGVLDIATRLIDEGNRTATDEVVLGKRHYRRLVVALHGTGAVQVSLIDVTGPRHPEDALRRSEELLRQAQKLEAIGLLAGGVARDFNNLLTIIRGQTDLAQLNLDAGKEQLSGHLDEVTRATDRASDLVRQLLAFSRSQILNLRVVDLNQVVADTERMLRRQLGPHIEIRTALAPDLAPVQVDPGQMAQVLLNLAANASDAMPDGGTLSLATAPVEVDEGPTAGGTGVPPGAYVLLTVSDTGCGMSEAVRARLFEPFFTTKEMGRGTGLGLSTAYGIVRQSAGSITVESEPSRGTVVRILLPRAAEPVVPVVELASSPTSASAVVSGDRETVLVVDDEPSLRPLIGEILRLRGYRVLVAGEGAAALRVAAAHTGPIDLVLADLMMPNMGGIELATLLAATRPEARVMFMSGHAEAASAGQGVLPPGAAFVSKPFSVDGLAQAVREVLARPLEEVGVARLRPVALVDAPWRSEPWFDEAGRGVLVASDDRSIVDANDTACDLLGLDRGRLIGRRLDALIVPGSGSTTVEEAWAQFIAEGRRAGRCQVWRGAGAPIEVSYEAHARIGAGRHLGFIEPVVS